MTPIGALFVFICAALVYSQPRQRAILSFLIGAAYMTQAQELEVGPLHFSATRILVGAGFLRVMMKRESLPGALLPVDKALITWGVVAIVSFIFHEQGAFVYRLGLVYNDLGIYFLLRVLVQDKKDVLNLFKAIGLILLPLAVLMVLEKLTDRNYFSFLGGVAEHAVIRHGKVRAQGPFSHPILAGTAGAACIGMAIFALKLDRVKAVIGIASLMGLVYASGSSGPVMTVLSILFGMAMWRFRSHMKKLRAITVVMVIVLNFIMADPVYYLIAKIDITGGSTGWHRAALIESSINHLGEWWLGGTDVTRHWMPTGVVWNLKHTDITNHYLKMGVIGGLPLMFAFIAVLYYAFKSITQMLQLSKIGRDDQKLVWTLGATLFGHAAGFISVTYFDQSIVFLYLNLAMIASLYAVLIRQQRAAVTALDAPPPPSSTNPVAGYG